MRNLAIAAGAFGAVVIAALVTKSVTRVKTVGSLTGAIVTESTDPHLQRPVGNALVTAAAEASAGKSVSGSSGLFRVPLEPPVPVGETVKLSVSHPDYQPLEAGVAADDRIHVLRLTPNGHEEASVQPGEQVQISNIRVRYATQAINTTNIGTAVRTFEIVNKGNVPCQGQQPCSPDGRWKAAIRPFSLDTGDDVKQFRNVRVSCIAGPCAFSRVEIDGFSRGGRVINVSVRNWSDTVTYLLEAEVAQTRKSELIRYTYPVTFGRSMNFSLPAEAAGPSIEAEVDGLPIVFPLGPALRLSWATCRFQLGPDDAKQYRCELKPGYRF